MDKAHRLKLPDTSWWQHDVSGYASSLLVSKDEESHGKVCFLVFDLSECQSQVLASFRIVSIVVEYS